MAKPIQIAILANGKQASRELDSLSTRAAKWGKVMVGVGAVAAVAIGKQMVTAASNAQQSIGATEQIFGRYADTVIKRSKQAATALGLSANEYRELNNVTGAMLQSSGMPLRKVADLTDRLTQRAADMAATFGGTTREAVEAVSSLLRGEADPIERYGVSIKQSDVNARLAAKGLDKLTGSAKKTAEQQARIDLLFQQSKKSGGQFSRESGTWAGQQQRFAAQIENVKARIGTMLLPALTRAAKYANKELIPALESGAEWLEKNSDEFGRFGNSIKDQALPPIKDLVGIVKAAVEFVADLPGPIRETGVQAGIAALILPRLAGAVAATGAAMSTGAAKTRQFHAELTYAETRAQRAGAVMASLGGAAKTAAGIGGMVALTQSTQTSNQALSTLLATAGGAATGFALGGPVGAAVGVLGGLTSVMVRSKQAMDPATTAAGNYAAALDQVSGAARRAAQAEAARALQEQGALKLAQGLGLTTRDLVGATLGNEAAQRRVNAVFAKQLDTLTVTTDAYGNIVQKKGVMAADAYKLAQILGVETEALAASRAKVRELAIANGDLERSLKGVQGRSKIVTRVERRGWPEAIGDVARLSRGLKLTPPQVKTTLKAFGFAPTEKNVARLKEALRNLPNVKPVDTFTPGIAGVTKKGADAARKGGKGVQESLKNSTKVKPSTIWHQYLDGSLATGRSKARSGSEGIGTDLKNGLPRGFAGADGLWSSEVSRAVNAAIAAGKNAADSHSPSRKTMALGRDLGDGLVIGLARKQAAAKKAGGSLVGAALAGAAGGSKGIAKLLDRMERLVKKRTGGKTDKEERKREAARLKALKDEFAALAKNGKAQDRINAKLATARDRYKELVRAAKDYGAGIRDSIVASADITQLGRNDEDSTVSIDLLLEQERQKLIRAQRFAALVEQLRKKLNKTSLDQILAAGVDNGLATAEALAAGGQTAINEINQITAQITTVGQGLGDRLATQFHGAGIQAADGIVQGLEKQKAKIDKAATRLAKIMVKAIKKELGIKSPSRVGKSLGANFGSSIDLGTSNVDLSLSGRRLSRALVKGFGDPTLAVNTAWQAATASNAAQQPTRVSVHFTAEQISAMQRGESIVADVDLYLGNGGTSRTIRKAG